MSEGYRRLLSYRGRPAYHTVAYFCSNTIAWRTVGNVPYSSTVLFRERGQVCCQTFLLISPFFLFSRPRARLATVYVVVFFGLATNTLNVRNNSRRNVQLRYYRSKVNTKTPIDKRLHTAAAAAAVRYGTVEYSERSIHRCAGISPACREKTSGLVCQEKTP